MCCIVFVTMLPVLLCLPAGNPLDDAKLLFNTVASIVRANALRSSDSKSVDVNFGSKATQEFQQRVGVSA